MAGTFEETLLSVWRQVMLDDFAVVVLDGRSWLVKRTARRRLRQVDFQFDGKNIRGLDRVHLYGKPSTKLSPKGHPVFADDYKANIGSMDSICFIEICRKLHFRI
jgi:hypothetical protein